VAQFPVGFLLPWYGCHASAACVVCTVVVVGHPQVSSEMCFWCDGGLVFVCGYGNSGQVVAGCYGPIGCGGIVGHSVCCWCGCKCWVCVRLQCCWCCSLVSVSGETQVGLLLVEGQVVGLLVQF